MNTKELNYFIRSIQNQVSKDEAYIGFYYQDQDEYTSYIKANREGLLLFANQLLQASLEFDDDSFKENTDFDISYEVDMTHSAFNFSHIELLNKPKSKLEKPKEYKQTFKDQMGCFIAIAIGLFALVCLLVGVYTVISSLF